MQMISESQEKAANHFADFDFNTKHYCREV